MGEKVIFNRNKERIRDKTLTKEEGGLKKR